MTAIAFLSKAPKQKLSETHKEPQPQELAEYSLWLCLHGG